MKKLSTFLLFSFAIAITSCNTAHEQADCQTTIDSLTMRLEEAKRMALEQSTLAQMAADSAKIAMERAKFAMEEAIAQKQKADSLAAVYGKK